MLEWARKIPRDENFIACLSQVCIAEGIEYIDNGCKDRFTQQVVLSAALKDEKSASDADLRTKVVVKLRGMIKQGRALRMARFSENVTEASLILIHFILIQFHVLLNEIREALPLERQCFPNQHRSCW